MQSYVTNKETISKGFKTSIPFNINESITIFLIMDLKLYQSYRKTIISFRYIMKKCIHHKSLAYLLYEYSSYNTASFLRNLKLRWLFLFVRKMKVYKFMSIKSNHLFWNIWQFDFNDISNRFQYLALAKKKDFKEKINLYLIWNQL